ncbi:hypothetical protein [Microvirga calopogonii]|uniref:hypothetical protein n=1 Tax=Microvirga calopogonii TaxID=2078013 RepID=UPI000E0D7AAC|nr:hypothetical protein [Microvirga calopogonii]
MTTLSESEKESLAAYVRMSYGTDNYEIVGACRLLWPPVPGPVASGKAVLVALPSGRRVWAALHALAIPPERIAPMLRQRISAYRDAIAETEALLTIAGER